MSSHEEPTREPVAGLDKAIHIDTKQIRGHLDQLVRESVEETLNKMLDLEAEQLCNARRYERSPDRLDYRAGHYTRKLDSWVKTLRFEAA